jgi:inner membrane protein
MQFLLEPSYWYWWIAGLLLAILEIFAPGVVFIWLGLAAGAVGIIVFAAPELDWKLQFLLFSVLSVASIVASRRFLKRHPIETDHPDLNRRGHQYIGRSYTIAEPIRDGRGRLHVDDTMWKIVGPDLPAGSRIRVTGVDGSMLLVEKTAAEAPASDSEARQV